MNKLYIIGVGPGAKELILPKALGLIERSDVLIGGRRNLKLFENLDKEKIIIGNNLEEISRYIEDNIDTKSISLIVTGDPGLYSALGYLKSRLRGITVEVIPGVSSIQYLCCKQNKNWEDMFITSLHGREQNNFIDIIGEHKKTAVFTGGETTPDMICSRLLEAGLRNIRVTVGENLTYKDERIISGTPEDISKLKFQSLTIMLIEHDGTMEDKKEWDFTNSTVPDDMFIRGNVPMTKEEVRAVSISKLRLQKDSIVFDIGAGTGAISVECALRCKQGKVYAIEKNQEACSLINGNADKFGVKNLEVVMGEAPAVLNGLLYPNRVFVGGTSGNMEGILEWVGNSDKALRIVINAITLESVYEALKGLEKNSFEDIEVVNMAVSRGKNVGGKHLMQALNPVYIISAQKV